MKLTIFDAATENYTSPPLHITREDLEKYGNGDTFIETGTYYGETVDMVLESGLFKLIHTIELNDSLFEENKKKYSANNNVWLWHGDSVEMLGPIVKALEGPATFWLDAHASGPLGGGKSGGSPLLDELDIIASSPFKNHTIIIDDIRLFGSSEWDYITKEAAIEKLLKINPDYNFYYLDGQVPGDVLWATVK